MPGVISADSHIDLRHIPDEIFIENAPAEFKERMPRLSERRWNAFVSRGSGPNWDRMAATGFFDDANKGIYRPGVPELRRKDQEGDGVQAEVIYGILGADRIFPDDPQGLRVCYRIYAEWVADFCNRIPGKFAALTPISCHDPKDAAEDLRHAASLGLKGVELKPSVAVKQFWHKDWEPLWEASSETGLPVHFHSDISFLLRNLASDEDRRDYPDVVAALTGSMGKMANAQYLGAVILSGVLERHPDMKLVMGECDVSWIPHFLVRMDYMVKEREHTTGLPLLPTEYWQRQCKATFQHDTVGMELIDRLGADNIMWGNDYPHPDGVWPISQQVIADSMAGLSAEVRQKITHDNAAALYGLN